MPEFLRGVNELIEEVHDSMFHYTNRTAAESMGKKGVLWLTRADCFLDEQEVHYGVEILLAEIAEIGERDVAGLYKTVDEHVREVLRSSFVLSLTHIDPNEYLIENYGRDTVVFEPAFQMHFNAAAFNVKEGLNYQVVSEIYEHLAGKVIYDPATQRELAKRVARAVLDFEELQFSDEIERTLHLLRLRKSLLTAVILMKEPNFEPEAEYRICLLRSPNNPDEPIYDLRRPGSGKLDGREIVFTQIFLPPANKCITVRYDESKVI